jgi:hypothetical protein
MDLRTTDLLDDLARPLARTTDPATSKAAAREIVDRLPELQRFALRAVENYPGRTANELSEALGLRDPRTLNRRLGEVEAAGLVRRAAPRRCAVSGRTAATWEVKEN